jgi:hypothetical protein
MAITVVGSTVATGGTGGVATPITPTLPGGVVNGDRVIAVQFGYPGVATIPASWNQIFNTFVGGGTGGSSTGPRYLVILYRDKDAAWSTMPAFALNPTTNGSQMVGVIAIRPTSGATFDTPTVSTHGNDTTANTAYSATTGSLTTTAGGLLISATARANAAAIPMSAESLTQAGATLGALTQQIDTGSTTGFDVAGNVETCTVTTGASAALVFTGTLPGIGSTGGTTVVQQTETAPPAGNTGAFFAMF